MNSEEDTLVEKLKAYEKVEELCESLEATKKKISHVWSTPARIIGFESKTVWLLCEGVPVASALDKLRPCTAPEVLTHEVLTRGYEFRSSEQQRFVDQREALAAEDDPELDGDDMDEDELPELFGWNDDSTFEESRAIEDDPTAGERRPFEGETAERNVGPRISADSSRS